VDGYFAGLRGAQQQYLPQVRDDFAPVPVRTVPFFDREVVGTDGLREIGQALFGDEDPASFFYRGRPYRIRAEGGVHILEVALPFTSREELGLSRDGDELVLQVGGWRRTLMLPRALVDVPTTGAKMEDGILRIEFSTRIRAVKKEARRRLTRDGWSKARRDPGRADGLRPLLPRGYRWTNLVRRRLGWPSSRHAWPVSRAPRACVVGVGT